MKKTSVYERHYYCSYCMKYIPKNEANEKYRHIICGRTIRTSPKRPRRK